MESIKVINFKIFLAIETIFLRNLYS